MVKNLSVKFDNSDDFISALINYPNQVTALINDSIDYFINHPTIDREDMVQDIYTHLLTNAGHKYNGSLSKGSTFIQVCAKQYILNVIRKLRTQEMCVDTIPESTYNHNFDFDNKELYSKIVLGEKDSRMRAILRAKFEDKLTLKEIASLPDVGVSFVRVKQLFDEWVHKNAAIAQSA